MRSLRLLLLTALCLLGFTACQRVSIPTAGDIEGVWEINDSVERRLGPNVPVIAKLTLRNLTEGYLSFPDEVQPLIHLGDRVPSGEFESLGSRPEIIPPGESASASWLLVQVEGPGDYEIEADEATYFGIREATLHLTTDPAPSLVASLYRGQVGYLKGEGEAELERLEQQLLLQPPPPAEVHFLIAEVHAALGHDEFAQEHYGKFVDLIFGEGEPEELALPSWLRERLPTPPPEPILQGLINAVDDLSGEEEDDAEAESEAEPTPEEES